MKIGSFPEIVNDHAARIVAFFVLLLAMGVLFSQSVILASLLAFGFMARVLYGPRFEPFARLTLHVIVPLFGISNKPVAGPPKRFAQLVGLIFSSSALVFLITGHLSLFTGFLSVLAFFAALESIFGFCAGCFVFGYLMKFGLIPQEICERCNNLKFNPYDTTNS